jgi:hypothetical protein
MSRNGVRTAAAPAPALRRANRPGSEVREETALARGTVPVNVDAIVWDAEKAILEVQITR